MKRHLVVARYVLKKNLFKLLLLCVIAFLFGVFSTDALLARLEQKERFSLLGEELNDVIFLYTPYYDGADFGFEGSEFQRLEQVLKSDKRIKDAYYFYHQTWGRLPDSQEIILFSVSRNYLEKIGLIDKEKSEANSVWPDNRLSDVFSKNETFSVQLSTGDGVFTGNVTGFLSAANLLPIPSVLGMYDHILGDLTLNGSGETFVALTSHEALAQANPLGNSYKWRVVALECVTMSSSELEGMKAEFYKRGLGELYSYPWLREQQIKADRNSISLIANVSLLFTFLLFLSAAGFMLTTLKRHAAELMIFRLLGLDEKAAVLSLGGICAIVIMLFSFAGYLSAPYMGSYFTFFAYQGRLNLAMFAVPIAACFLFGTGACLSWTVRGTGNMVTTVRRERK